MILDTIKGYFNSGNRNQSALAEKFDLLFNFSAKTRLEFIYEPLKPLLSAGRAFDTSLQQLVTQYAKSNRDFVRPMQKILDDIKRGTSIPEAFGKFVPATEVIFLAAGERSGNYAGCVEELIEAVNQRVTSTRKMVFGLAGSITQLVITLLAVAHVSANILPNLSRMVSHEKWPAFSQALFVFGDFVVNYGGITAVICLVLGILSFVTLPTWTGRIRELFSTIPGTPWKIYRDYLATNILVSLSALVRSGVSVDEAMAIVAKISPPYGAQYVKTMISRLKAGMEYGTAMEVSIFTRDTVDLIAVYSYGAAFHESIRLIASKVALNSIISLDKQLASIKAALFIFIALFVGAMYLSMIVQSTLVQKEMTTKMHSRR